MTVNPTSHAVSGASSSGTPTSPSTATAAAAATGGLANQQVFFQLLVAQIQNQDPTTPTDPIQFVSELAQFSSLEQELQMRQDLDQINSDTTPPSPTTGSPAATTQKT